jgi:hypothetical protein
MFMDETKTMLTEKITASSTYVRKDETSQINNQSYKETRGK